MKVAFEKFANSCGVHMLHYHADNGGFADDAFIEDEKEQRQSISYCGV